MLNIPWILVGDFNAILNSTEHRGGTFDHYSIKSRHFNDFVSRNQLFDLGYQGSPYTWCNNQGGLARRWARLDRFLANNAWLTNFDSYYNKHLPRTSSDHSPLLLSVKCFTHINKRIFRFENFWFDYESCHQTVLKAWKCNSSASHLSPTSHAICRTRKFLSNWKNNGKNSLDIAISKTEEDIQLLESLESTLHYSDLSNIALRGMYNKHTTLLRQNLLRWAQRARLLWLKNGDYNTKFFQQHAKVRGHRNKISAITDDHGVIHSDRSKIESVFAEFYKKLWTTSINASMSDLMYSLPNDLPTLNDNDRDFLIRPVSPAEVYQTLKNMP
ncbi:hypothetical protein J5N97_020305 [Dioscorea zingiberensis]|uniref:Endonuclease/exonuclease/phosphatase domain-containing protein n=1 Tax=Dioscorea zingiberensis TaxID=325984 RepID=A0A9D5HD39_9LILI|nr:hypothetical protein J5N97_020305 [Dioscorea zingiberensis]